MALAGELGTKINQKHVKTLFNSVYAAKGSLKKIEASSSLESI